MVWVMLENGLKGLLDLQNNIVLPPIYTSLSYIDDGEFKGQYNVVLNGVEDIIKL